MRTRSNLASGILSRLMLAALALSLPTLAQTPTVPTPPRGASIPRLSGRPRQIPCWQQVGVLPAVMQRIKGIRDNTRGQVSTACSDSSLSRDQKLDKIAGIKKSAREQIDALIPPHTQEAMRSCQTAHPRRQRRRRNPVNTSDPCASTLPRQPAASDPDGAEKPAAPNGGAAAAKDAAPGKPANTKKSDDDFADDDAVDPKN